MAEVNKYGKIILCIKDIGTIIKQMEGVDSFIQTGMSMKDNGKMIKHMVKEYITITTGQVIMGNGNKTYNKDKEYRNGMMDHHIKGIVFINI
jgi:hypothetical protein